MMRILNRHTTLKYMKSMMIMIATKTIYQRTIRKIRKSLAKVNVAHLKYDNTIMLCQGISNE